MRDQWFMAANVLLIVTALLALACVVSQALLARWWETPAGRHVFAFQGVVAALASLWSLRVWFPDNETIRLLRNIAFVGLPVVIGWRLAIIIRTWRAKRRKHKEAL
ncbi:putative phage holin [Nonomuraea sp. NPDC004702]